MNIKNYWNWLLTNTGIPLINGSWLSFDTNNTNIPTLITSPVVPNNSSGECASSISDDNGNVIYYTNGLSIYDSTNTLLPVFFNDVRLTLQGIVSIQNPYNSNEYYAFYLKNWIDNDNCGGQSWLAWGNNELWWSKLVFSGQTYVSSSMNNVLAPAVANSGAGGFCHTGKGYAEVITLVPHDNGTDFWVITKPTGTESGGPTSWEIFLVDSLGPNSIPVKSTSNFVFDGKNRRGGLKGNLYKDKILLAVGDDDLGTRQEAAVVFAEFDNSTGKVSNETILMKTSYTYNVFDVTSGTNINITSNTSFSILGCEFSPNSRFAYIIIKNGVLQIDLYNLSTWPQSVVPNSTVTIPTANALFMTPSEPGINLEGMQLGPDKLIYYNTTSTFSLRIDTPDLRLDDPNFAQSIISYSVYGPNHEASRGLPLVYVGAFVPLNYLLTACDGKSPSIIVTPSQVVGNVVPGDSICILTNKGKSTCYTVSETQDPVTTQDTITPNNVFNSCTNCLNNCFYTYYQLFDCYSGELYLDSNGLPVQFFYDKTTSSFVKSLGGITLLTSVVLTDIYNSSKVKIASGCLVLKEVDYTDGQIYTDIVTGIDKVLYTETCLQCKLKSCGDCDTLYTENVNCKYGDQVYAVMISNRYGLETCCREDLQKWDIKKELNDLTNLKHTYIPCCEKCSPNCNTPTCTQSSCGCNH